MLQKEVVARMAARPGGKDYGRLTVMLAPWVRVEPLFDIGTGAFSPPPRVVSTFFALHAAPSRRRSMSATPALRARGGGRVRAAAQDPAQLARRRCSAPAQIAAAGVDPAARPETLAPAQFAALARQLSRDRPRLVRPAPATYNPETGRRRAPAGDRDARLHGRSCSAST